MDASKLTMGNVRYIFQHYPVDTAVHYGSGANFESRYLHVAACVPDGATVLDVGCNTGGAGKRLREEKGCAVYGVEPNNDWAYQAYSLRKYTKVWADLLEDAVVSHDPEWAGCFDAVICMGVLEHPLDLDVFIKAALFPLRAGGVMCGDTVNVKGRWNPATHDNVMRAWSPDSARAFLEQYLDGVEAVDGFAKDNCRPDFVFWRGVKR